MLRRVRVVVIWLALAFIAAASIGSATWMIREASHREVAYKQFASDSTQADANRARVDEQRSCGPLTAQARAKCDAEEYYAAHQAQHDDADLEAQRTTAIWTKYLGIAGIAGTAFGLIGVALVLLTFMEQRKTSRAELRAYVDVNKAVLMETEGRHYLHFSVTNFGQTPATNVRVWSHAHLMTWPILEEPKAIILHAEGGTLPPGHPRRFRVRFLSDQWNEMLKDTASFVIPIKVEYDFLDGSESDRIELSVVVSCREVVTGEARTFNYRDKLTDDQLTS